MARITRSAILLHVTRKRYYRATKEKMNKIDAGTKVRYIKLGEGVRWERECLEKGIIRFGFGSAKADRFSMCIGAKWDDLTKSFLSEGKTQGTATRFTNETRRFFEDDGTTLWITFIGQQLWWGFVTPRRPQQHTDGDGVWRTVAGGWRGTDIHGERLTNDRLSGSLTKVGGLSRNYLQC